ncbi:MAG: pentapeptide repeat-containing protein [Alphaproteobacteria bacterium]
MNEVFKTKHPLFKEINIKFLNNNPNSDRKNFDVNLNNDKKFFIFGFFSVRFNTDKTKLIINNGFKIKEYDVFEGEEEIRKKGEEKISYNPHFKCIHPDNIENFDGKDKNKICRIIENDGTNDYKDFFKVELNENKTKLIIDDGNESKEYNISKKEDKKIISLPFKFIYPKDTEKLDEEIIFRIIENIELNNNGKNFSVKHNNNEKKIGIELNKNKNFFGFRLNKNKKKLDVELKKNRKEFDVELSDDGKKLIITNNGKAEEYDVFKKTIDSTEFKYISVEKDNSEIIFKIIENNDQIENFYCKYISNYIFLEKIDITKTVIDSQEETNLSFFFCIFKDGCYSQGNNHTEAEIINSNFEKCIFLGNAGFSFSIFKDNREKWGRSIPFSDSAFLDEADFMYTKFESDAFFNNCIFKEVNFNRAEFKQYTSFENSKFVESLNLSKSKINKMNLANTNIKKLHLTDVDIENYINCEHTEIEDAGCRETFRTLKESCMKKYDNILALDFYKREMKQYKSELDWKKNFIKKFILSLEKVMSNYGTNPFLPIFWFLPLHYIDYVIRDYDKKIYNDLENGGFNIYNLNIMEIIFNPSNPSNLLGFWFLIKLVLSSILIYEIIKSFRMFSRKL